MPAYDYKCPACDTVGEFFHGMSEKPEYVCPDCGVGLRRIYNSFGMSHGKRLVQGKIEDKLKAETDMKQEMKDDYGVESFKPVGATSMKEVYNDVKSSGSFVKERMKAEAERTQAARDKKAREWKKGAMKRAPQKSREMVERKKAKAAADRAVKI